MDRSLFQIAFTTQDEYAGLLAESWEQPDPSTIIFHLRQGIHWQNIDPVNGREVTADDVVYSWDRELGLGQGFTKPSPFLSLASVSMITSVTATNKYTVVFKSAYPTITMFDGIMNPLDTSSIIPKETITKWGDITDWHHVIGTGPFILTDYVSGSSLTFAKNPNYWGYDERHPNNQLPYVDGVTVLIMPDSSTMLAAVRSGKITLAANLTMQQASDMENSHPEIVQWKLPQSGYSLQTREDMKPYTDIRVREALQMALDLPTIVATYYNGEVSSTPYPLIGPGLGEGYNYPYDQWPQSLKDTYTYNPTAAKQLLAAAGYPDGFTTDVVASSSGIFSDLDLLQIIKSYFLAIGVKMDIRTMEVTAWKTFAKGGKADQLVMSQRSAMILPLGIAIANPRSTDTANFNCTHDPVYDNLVNTALATFTAVDFKAAVYKCDKYADENHFSVILPQTVTFNINQPWLKGYSGEYFTDQWGTYSSRWWIDQNLEK